MSKRVTDTVQKFAETLDINTDIDGVMNFDENRIQTIVVKSHFDELKIIYGWLASIIENESEVEVVYNCLQELVCNAIEHGNKSDFDKKITIELYSCNTLIFVTVEDEGKGFPWQEIHSGPLNIRNGHERGRGIAMTKLFSEKLHYNEKGNIAYLVLRRFKSSPT